MKEKEIVKPKNKYFMSVGSILNDFYFNQDSDRSLISLYEHFTPYANWVLTPEAYISHTLALKNNQLLTVDTCTPDIRAFAMVKEPSEGVKIHKNFCLEFITI